MENNLFLHLFTFPSQNLFCAYQNYTNVFRLFVCLLQIEDMCHRTGASAVPVVPDSEGSVALDACYFCVPVLDLLLVYIH